jgi:hypothetical protein
MESFIRDNRRPDRDPKYETEMLNPYTVKLSPVDVLIKWVHT